MKLFDKGIGAAALALAILLGGFSTQAALAAGQKPDLVPVLSHPMTGKVAVKNKGAAASLPSVLTIECKKVAGRSSGCAESARMKPYEHRAYPNKVVVEIPALAPGQTYSHVLLFWQGLDWQPGTYKFFARADAGNSNAESNENNNKKTATLKVQ